MRAALVAPGAPCDPEFALPATLLARYLFFLARRPISASNRHFLGERAAGLRALAVWLAERAGPEIAALAGRARGLTGPSVAAVARELAPALAPLLPRSPARDVLPTAAPPDPGWLAHARRLRLVLGPGIGLGDETLCRALPAWLRTLAPGAAVEVASTRPELWRAAPVDAVAAYADGVELLQALRGDGCDAVLLADFETPALAAAVTRQPGAVTYVELALGARALQAFDARTRRLHERLVPGARVEDYYRFAEQALRWLGARADLRAPRVERAPRPGGDGRLVLVASPFTSKYEPSEAAWSALLAALVPPGAAPGVRLLVEPGPNLASERWAAGLVRAVRARAAPRLACDLAPEAGARTLGLDGLLRLFERADVVVCADTFAAHAAPQAGCATLVVAGDELRAWRVPHAPAFYFPAAAAPHAVARAMRHVLAALDPRWAGPDAPGPWRTPAAAAADGARVRLARALAEAPALELLAAYESCGAGLRALLCERDAAWPRDAGLLFGDRRYEELLPPLPSAGVDARRPELADHIGHLLSEWENSNLAKYLALAARGAGA